MANVIAERAMLSRLKIQQWTARRLDKKVTKEVNDSHNADSDAGRYNKRLVSKHALADLVRIAGAARATHYQRTLPWQDEGARILPAAGYLEYSEAMRVHRAEFDSAVMAFCNGYADFITDARISLNGLFKESDYPSAASIASRFTFAVGILPWPESADFRVALAGDQAAAIRAEIEANSAQALNDAMRDVWQRVAEHVGHMAERLKGFKPGATGERAEGIFRDSLVENVRDLARLLPSLNITADPGLAAIADRMTRDLCQESAEALRDNPTARASVAAAAEKILSDVSEFLA